MEIGSENMADREKVIYGLCTAIGALRALKNKFPSTEEDVEPGIQACIEAKELLKEQDEIKEQFIEAFNTIRDAYNAPTTREKILLNYLARNGCCCERKQLIDGGQFADMPTMQSAT